MLIPRKAGKYSALAIYGDVLSNPLYLQTKEPGENKQKDNAKEKLLSIDLLPYRPSIAIGGSADFVALGTFINYDLNEYSVRDISKEVAWSMRQLPNLAWDKEDGNRISFFKQGQAEVLSQYNEAGSSSQRVEVKDRVDLGERRLKHLLVLPEVMMLSANKS